MIEAARADCYVDTSALVKRYVSEVGSDAFDDFSDHGAHGLVICPLGVTELSSVLQAGIRTKRLSPERAAEVRRRFQVDIDAGGLRIAAFAPALFSSADTLINDLDAPIATLDALHLACAMAHRIDAIATGDRQLATAAAKVRLQVHFFG